MEPYTPGAEIFEDGVLYTARFPVPTQEELDAELARYEDEYPELRRIKDAPVPSAAEIIREAEERYTYKPRPEAKEGQAKFIELAIGLSKQYEISMEVKRREQVISVQMDLYAASYFGAVKNWLDALLHMASEYSILPKGKEYVSFSLDYALYDRYDNKTGEKVDW